MDRLLDTPVELLDRHLEANVMAPVILTRLVLPGMVERGTGSIVNLASSSGADGPAGARRARAGGASATACPRAPSTGMAGILAVELGDRGILAFNLSPGFVATERIALDMAGFGFDASRRRTRPTWSGAVAAWLVTSPEARRAQRRLDRGPGGLPRPRPAPGLAATGPVTRRHPPVRSTPHRRPAADRMAPWPPSTRSRPPTSSTPCSTGCRTGGGGVTDDERGTLNHLTDERRAAAARSVRTGESSAWPTTWPPSRCPSTPTRSSTTCWRRATPGTPTGSPATRRPGTTWPSTSTACGPPTSTPCPTCSCAGQMYGGRPASEVRSDGARSNTVLAMADGVVGRGVLLDVPRALGCDFLGTGRGGHRGRPRGGRGGPGGPGGPG